MEFCKIYLINLERCKDRLDHFMKEATRIGLPLNKIQIFKAIDGNTHEFTSEEMDMFGVTKEDLDMYQNNHTENKRVLACYLSHYYVMADIQKNKYKTCLVLEDDVRFVSSFMNDIQNVLSDLHKVTLSLCHIGQHALAVRDIFLDFPIEDTYNPYDTYCLSKQTDYLCKLKPSNNPCCLSYIVNAESCIDLVNSMKTNKKYTAIDSFYNQYLSQNDIFYASFKVLTTGNSKLQTTIHNKTATLEDMLVSYKLLHI
jgi:GR25 family glycosyltransferase involved in LPS biosynthesis